MMMLFNLPELVRNYITRVELDGGTVESVDCIEAATPSIIE
jgi:hypothetical protein